MPALDEMLALLAPIAKAKGLDLTDLDADELVKHLDDDTVQAMLAPILADEERAKFNRFADLFPDEGPLRRELYPKHLEFFRAGKDYRERCLMAGNRTGKSIAAAYEITCHLTGMYPLWWEGRRFARPVRAWAAGDTNETTRDIIQHELLGQVVDGEEGRKALDGSGLIPRECIGRPKWKQGVQDFVDTIQILHTSGGWSHLGLKSFDQGRKKFQGTAREVIWLDEECPADVYDECKMRTMTTRGIVMLTFTPLQGLTDTVMQFLPKEMRPGQA